MSSQVRITAAVAILWLRRFEVKYSPLDCGQFGPSFVPIDSELTPASSVLFTSVRTMFKTRIDSREFNGDYTVIITV